MHSIVGGARARDWTQHRCWRAGIPAALLESPLARISQQQYALLIHVLRRTLRDEMWGLLSRPLPPGSFGQCMRQLVRCATLQEALRDGFAFYHLLVPDFVPRLSVRGDTAHVQFVLRRPADARPITRSRPSCCSPTKRRRGWWRAASRC